MSQQAQVTLYSPWQTMFSSVPLTLGREAVHKHTNISYIFRGDEYHEERQNRVRGPRVLGLAARLDGESGEAT